MARHVRAFRIDFGIPFQLSLSSPRDLARLEMGVIHIDGKTVLGSGHPKIIVRHPSRNDDTRTMIATALPEKGTIHSKGYVHAVAVTPATSLRDELALLAYLNSVVCDWWVRRLGDRHITAPLVNNTRLPTWSATVRTEAADIACELLHRNGLEALPGGHVIASVPRYSSSSDEDLLAQIDILSAVGFSLSRNDMKAILEDFSERACSETRRELILNSVA